MLRPPPPGGEGMWCNVTCHTYHNYHQMVYYVGSINSEIPTFQVSIIKDIHLVICDITTNHSNKIQKGQKPYLLTECVTILNNCWQHLDLSEGTSSRCHGNVMQWIQIFQHLDACIGCMNQTAMMVLKIFFSNLMFYAVHSNNAMVCHGKLSPATDFHCVLVKSKWIQSTLSLAPKASNQSSVNSWGMKFSANLLKEGSLFTILGNWWNFGRYRMDSLLTIIIQDLLNPFFSTCWAWPSWFWLVFGGFYSFSKMFVLLTDRLLTHGIQTKNIGQCSPTFDWTLSRRAQKIDNCSLLTQWLFVIQTQLLECVGTETNPQKQPLYLHIHLWKN